MAARLSVNVNKVATLRNARGGDVPSVIAAVRTIVAAGAPGITIHPRADERHIRAVDARAIATELAPLREQIEFNIEGDPRPDLLAMVEELRPHQCTLVPVRPGEITSQAGWPTDTSRTELGAITSRLHGLGVRVSLFIEADLEAVRWARDVGAQRIELYTEPFARGFAAGRGEAELARFAAAAELAHDLGLGINAGHDLDLDNLPLFSRLPHLDEVSIGHALISHALFVGLDRAVRDYLAVLVE
ncbi:pyridoxine 5'-phosphate synthase [Nannocystis sp. ILAH1]|uniref:pyridoxine 5'-phosphate synthase n=1 Tax=unclassified Nannocystis TaxID=2627009 RepID=UPI00226EC6BD|nr:MULTISPECIES: pyridoxine 5'-phosphate synthase [unclassified Nannocystis]MCY0990196.1 pyridoxine 5'-phosphate synthase [Nannocystis sp. ILAH1]MCY1069515.1 pyridoxine 5'-phosphate synthase [Nannocystis sp. RBIL2]